MYVSHVAIKNFRALEDIDCTFSSRINVIVGPKRLISDLHKASRLKLSEAAFKARIVEKMRDTKADTWRLVESILNEFFKPIPAR